MSQSSKLLERKIEAPDRYYYLVKWMDKPYSECTWEPEQNLSCPDLIWKLEKELRERKLQDTPPTTPKPVQKAVEVLSASCAHGSVVYLLRMEDSRVQLMYANEARKLYPKLIFNYQLKYLKDNNIKLG